MPNVLDEIVANKKVEIAKMQSSLSLDVLQEHATPASGHFAQTLRKPGINLITEIKPKSPSAGVLRTELNLSELLEQYCQYASAISVLTDAKYFGGSFDLLKEVSQKTNLPLLCKDFVLDQYQCYVARSMGAEAVLLIVKILTDDQLARLSKLIASLGMTAVVEVQNVDEAKRAVALGSQCILINNRNLETLAVDLDTTIRLAPLIPRGVIAISASGIAEREQIEYLSQACTNFLIGSSLMKSQNIAEKLATLKGQLKTEKAIG
jgi:indole-3-glycerol phosphate synthase / phosphoribosylanthranilate isomerase